MITVPAYTYAARIIDVHDGDTLTAAIDLGFSITHTLKLRLSGINAPELGQSGGKEARDFLKELLLNKSVVVKTEKDHTEKYGRFLATILLQSSVEQIDVNQLLISKGYAVAYKA